MKELLKKLNACQEAVEWVGDKTLEEAWNTCHRGDWMLWLYAKMYPDNLKQLTLAKGHCANTVRHLMKDQRSLDAVDAAIAFGEGKISREDLKADSYASYAADAAYAADDAAYAADAAAYDDAAYDAAAAAYDDAAYASADAAASYASASYASAAAAYDAAAYASDADAYASDAAAAAAYDADYASAADADAADAADAATARQKNQQQTADICRKYLTLCTH